MHAGMEGEHADGGESHGGSEQNGHAHEAGDADHEAPDPAASTISMAGLAANAVPAAESAANAFHEALKRGDRQAVLALLAPEVVIHEGGETQDREEHTSELQSLMRISYADFCLKKKNKQQEARER